MESVAVQWIGNIHDAMRRIYTDRRIIDRIGHRGVESPVPVWDSEGRGSALILPSLGCWVLCGDLLCVVPKYLLIHVSSRAERLDRMIGGYLKERHVGSMP